MPKVGQEHARKTQICAAVIRCIADTGFQNLTIDAVARAAGVSKGVVNHYFHGKRDLLVRSFQSFIEDYHRRADGRIHAGQSADEMIRVIVDLTLSTEGPTGPDSVLHGLDNRALGRVWLAFLGASLADEAYVDVLREVYAQYLEGTTAVIRYGQETDRFGPGDAGETSAGLMALLDGMLLHRILGLALTAPGRDREACLAFVNRMLPAAGGAAEPRRTP